MNEGYYSVIHTFALAYARLTCLTKCSINGGLLKLLKPSLGSLSFKTYWLSPKHRMPLLSLLELDKPNRSDAAKSFDK